MSRQLSMKFLCQFLIFVFHDQICDWIFWMDGDTILERYAIENKGQRFRTMCEKAIDAQLDAVAFGHYNLWRSKRHYRIDDSYHSIHDRGVMAFWKNNGNLKFSEKHGLHHLQYPEGIVNPVRTNLNLIHMGFATDYQIMKKYDTYKERGQKGWALDRILSEETLRVEELDKHLIPNWLEVSSEVNPSQLKGIREIYDEDK